MPDLKLTIQVTEDEAAKIKRWQAQGIIDTDDELLDALLVMRKPTKTRATATWILFVLSRLVAIGMLAWAVEVYPLWTGRHSYSYYQLLQIVVCAVCIFGMYCAVEWKQRGWIWLFAALVLLFNPLVPIALGRDVWQIVDVIAGVCLVATIFFLRPAKSS